MRIEFYTTSLIAARMQESPAMAAAVRAAIDLFTIGNWGKICEADKKLNDADLRHGNGRILARYDTPEGDIYIDCEIDPDSDNIATVMFCEEY